MQTRARVEGRLGYDLPDAAWEQLVDDGYVGEYELEAGTGSGAAEQALDQLVKRIRAFRAPMRPTQTEIEAPLRGVGARIDAITAWAERFANESTSVRAFRSAVLPEGLLAPEELPSWIAGRVEASSETVALEWGELKDGEWRAVRRAVPASGILGRLAAVAQELADGYRWSRAEAATFVLTAHGFGVRPIRGVVNFRTGSETDTATRVGIEVEPCITPEQLASWWREVRKAVLPRRYRPLQARSLVLAAFMAHTDESTTWDQDMAEWNAEHPEWRYDERRLFHRDATQAIKRLLFVGYTMP